MKHFAQTLKFAAVAVALPALMTACSGKPKVDDVNTPPATPAPVEPTHLHAKLDARSKSKTSGEVHFDLSAGDVITVKYEIKGLKKGSLHGFHIHEKGDCTAPDASSAGGHFNPSNQPHGLNTAATKHVGDLGNIKADKKGVAKGEVAFTGAILADIKGLAVIVHGKVDDGKTQPSGNAGDRIACGVLE